MMTQRMSKRTYTLTIIFKIVFLLAGAGLSAYCVLGAVIFGGAGSGGDSFSSQILFGLPPAYFISVAATFLPRKPRKIILFVELAFLAEIIIGIFIVGAVAKTPHEDAVSTAVLSPLTLFCAAPILLPYVIDWVLWATVKAIIEDVDECPQDSEGA